MKTSKEKLYYDKQYNCDLILLDGLWGCGKTLFNLPISSLSGLEDGTIEEFFESIIYLESLEKIEKNTASFLIENSLDFIFHKSLLGRCSNMRFNDDTGFKNSTNKLERIRRLFRSEEKSLDPKVIKDKGLVFMTHNIGCSPFFITDLLKERLYLIEIMRHPVHIFTHIATYFGRFDAKREKTVSFYYKNKKMPWFYKDFVELIDIDEENPNNKAVEYIYYCYLKTWDNIKTLQVNKFNIFQISMEQFAVETDFHLNQISNFLSRSKSKYTQKALKKARLPRKYIHNGHASKNEYFGWNKSNLDNKEYYLEVFNKIYSKIDGKYKSMFNEIIDLYDEKFPSIISEYAQLVNNV